MKRLWNFPMFGAFLESLFTVMYNRQERAARRFATKSLPKVLTLIAILSALIVVGGCIAGGLSGAVYSGNISNIRRHLDRGGDINAENEQGGTLLDIAVYYGKMEMVEFLINRGADVNVQHKTNGSTALMSAAVGGHIEIAKLLIERGADVNVQHKTNGSTALMSAAAGGHIEIAKLLIERGADVNAKDNRGNTALVKAVVWAAEDTEIANLLIERGADVNAKNSEGQTPFMQAVWPQGYFMQWDSLQVSNIKMMVLLMNRGADVCAEDNNGWTALLLVLKQGSKSDIENADFLLSKGCRLPEIPPNFAGLLVPASPVRILELNVSEYKGEVRIISLPPGICTVKVDYYEYFSGTGKPITLEFNTKAGHLYVIAHEVLKSRKLFHRDKWSAWLVDFSTL